MSFWEYDAERHLKIEKEDSYNDGFQDGIKQGIKQGIERGIEQGIESEKNNTLRERNRANIAEQKLAQLQEELRMLRGQLASGK